MEKIVYRAILAIYCCCLAYSGTAANVSFPAKHAGFKDAAADTTNRIKVLMLNYAAYDSAYANKTRRILAQHLPNVQITEQWNGSIADLKLLLQEVQVVVLVYASGGMPTILKAQGQALKAFARKGGTVVLTGTHDFSVLQQFDLFGLDFGYYCADPEVDIARSNHPLLRDVEPTIKSRNYAYPLDISDPAFVSLADLKGFPTLGYKPFGEGKLVYIGFEYYYEEPACTRLLLNAIHWGLTPAEPSTTPPNAAVGSPKTGSRTEEILFSGTGSTGVETMQVYPNPYTTKASLEIELKKASAVSIEMTDEAGKLVAVLLPGKNLNPGTYQFELPGYIQAGIYLVQCRADNQVIGRKVVKTNGN
jgi:hypothetical protein